MKEVELFSAADAGVSRDSVPFVIGDFREYSIQMKFSSATLNGTLSLEASNDEVEFVPLEESVQAVVSGTKHLWNVWGASYKCVRISWLRSSGTGTMTASFLLKEFPVKQG